MAGNGKFLGVPTSLGLIIGVVVIYASMHYAHHLYVTNGQDAQHYWIKVADYLLQGALITVLFTILKAVIDGARARAARARKGSS